jgi:hypothetical protein
MSTRSHEIFTLIDPHPDPEVQDSEYRRLLGYPADHPLEGRALELAEYTREWYRENGNPWAFARQTSDVEIRDDHVVIEGAVFSSGILAKKLRFASADSVVLAAVSAGIQCEERARELWLEGKPDEYFFLEVYGSAVVEHLVATSGYRMCDWGDRNGMAVLPHWSPGYPGWDIADQQSLHRLIFKNVSNEIRGEISVLDTGMLHPKKSLLAVFGLTRNLEAVRRLSDLIPCESCPMPACRYRRVPYRRSIPSLEDVRQLQPQDRTKNDDGPPENPPVSYALNPRALRKWSRERLNLEVMQDRSIRARFRFDGTTCSNMGMPLQFDYHLRLSPPEEQYRILEARCVPAPGDTGHTQMCDYIDDAETFMLTLEGERPLVGRPLEDVFDWNRPGDAAGCYCSKTSRDHKWGIVFEVLHYALHHANESSRQSV